MIQRVDTRRGLAVQVIDRRSEKDALVNVAVTLDLSQAYSTGCVYGNLHLSVQRKPVPESRGKPRLVSPIFREDFRTPGATCLAS
jgi:hypothetical protein